MSRVLKPTFVALDSSHLGDIARDQASTDPIRKQAADAFQRAFDASGSVVLLSWHHLQELLSHQDKDVVARRISSLQGLPLVACVNSASGENIIGGIIDLLAFEIRAAFEDPTADAVAIRDQAATNILRVTTGTELMRPFLEYLPLIQAEFVKQQERAREIVAISRSNFADVAHEKVVDLLRQGLRKPDDIHRRFATMHGGLSRDLRTRGDTRIPDATQTSVAFLESVRQFGMQTLTADNPGLQILHANGIELSDIDENTTVGDVGALATFRGRLHIINQITQLPWPELKARVTEKRLPSRIVERGIDKFRPDGKEWKGSDLNDGHLSCLAAYADVTYVDKRTFEAVRVAKAKMPEFAKLIRRVEKAGHYGEIAEQITR